MGGISVFHWLFLILSTAIVVLPVYRILRRMGFNGWWGLLAMLPLVNLVMLWIVAFIAWPIDRSRL